MDLDKTVHIHFTITGKDADRLDFYGYLNSLPEDWDFDITSSNVNLYANKIKVSK